MLDARRGGGGGEATRGGGREGRREEGREGGKEEHAPKAMIDLDSSHTPSLPPSLPPSLSSRSLTYSRKISS